MRHLLASQTLWLKQGSRGCNLEMLPSMGPTKKKEATNSPIKQGCNLEGLPSIGPTKKKEATSSPTKKNEKKEFLKGKKKKEKKYGRRKKRVYKRIPKEPIIEWEKRIRAKDARVREKKARICARFESRSGVVLNQPYVFTAPWAFATTVTHPYVVTASASDSASDERVDIEALDKRFQNLKKVASWTKRKTRKDEKSPNVLKLDEKMDAPSDETAKKQSRQATNPIYYEKASDEFWYEVTLTPHPRAP